jgi:FKBP-type peptidyl-prolyl cis-trans isomerase FkpA
MTKTPAVLLVVAALAAAFPALAAETPAKAAAPAAPAASATPAAPALETEDQKTLYALGIWLSNRVATLSLTEAEMKFVMEGFEDGVLGREKKVDLKTYGPKIDEMAKSRAGAIMEKEKKAGAAYADKAAAEKGAVKKPSGLIYLEEKAGTGASPAATDKVKVDYHGTLIDGLVFDSSVDRGQPVDFALNEVIKCWTEGLQLMKVGGKAKLVCPSDIAYGDQGRPGIKPGATLVFDIQLLDIVK